MACLGSLKLLGPMTVLIALRTLSFAETPQTHSQAHISEKADSTQDRNEHPSLKGEGLAQIPSQSETTPKRIRRIVASEVEAGPAESPAQASKTPSPHSSNEKKAPIILSLSKSKEELAQKQSEPQPESESRSSAVTNTSVVAHKFEGAAQEILDLIKRGVLRVAMCTIDQPPFHVRGPDGQFTGFDIDLSHRLAEALGIEVEFVTAPDWEATISLVVEGRADIMLSNMTLLPERATKLFCSEPYARIRQCMLLNRVLLARAEGKGLTTLRQIFSGYDNRTLIIQKGAAYETSAGSMFPQAKIETTESWEEILRKILNKEAFATISDEIEIKKQMRTVQTMELTAVTLKGMFDLMVIGISRKMPQLLHFINTFIKVENVECNLDQAN